MQSKATTVAQYLKELPADRRAIIAKVRQVILDNLDEDYEEGMQYGMIGYYVPHRVYPAGYHCDPKQPLPFAGLASQKNYVAVYLTGLYSNPDHERWFREAWAETGKKLDMGKCCVRFRQLEDVPLDVIGEAVARVPVSLHIERYEAALQGRRTSGRKAAPKPTKKSSKGAATNR